MAKIPHYSFILLFFIYFYCVCFQHRPKMTCLPEDLCETSSNAKFIAVYLTLVKFAQNWQREEVN